MFKHIIDLAFYEKYKFNTLLLKALCMKWLRNILLSSCNPFQKHQRKISFYFLEYSALNITIKLSDTTVYLKNMKFKCNSRFHNNKY